jgi:hypothetical protein
MGLSVYPSASAAPLSPKYQKFTSSGTFTLPTGYGAGKPLLVNIQVIGGGGGGSQTSVGAYEAYYNSYFGNGTIGQAARNDLARAGGSGGIATSQLYLTNNLTITIGAAGTRLTSNLNGLAWSPNNSLTHTFNPSAVAGSGGTSSAGPIQARGGVGGSMGVTYTHRETGFSVVRVDSVVGTGGFPAGTAGGANPSIGTPAGGSNDTTPIQGSFGVGGISTDGATTTGGDGTGGGATSIAAGGAVILTWWE